MKTNTFSLVIILFFSTSAEAANDELVGKIMSLLDKDYAKIHSESNKTYYEIHEELYKLAIDAGPIIAPGLRKIISTRGKNVGLASELLAMIGDDQDIDIIQDVYDEGLEGLKRSVCLARMSRGNEEDVEVIIKMMIKNDSAFPCNTIQTTLALASIHSENALPALKTIAEKTQDTWVIDAINRINSVPPSVDTHKLNNSNKEIIAAIIRNGIPGIHQVRNIRDDKNRGVWEFEDNTWIFKSSRKNNNEYNIDFDIHVSPDSKRAFVKLKLRIISSTYEYRYILENKEPFWRVRGIYLNSIVEHFNEDIYRIPAEEVQKYLLPTSQ